jgi:hypothetical protein
VPFEVAEELSIEIEDKAGALAGVLKVVADAGVAVRAFCGYSMGGAGNCMIVPSDAKKAKAALKKAGYKAIESSKVVVGTVKDKKGAGAAYTTQAFEKGINLEYSYATGTGKGTGVIVLNAGAQTSKLAKSLKD